MPSKDSMDKSESSWEASWPGQDSSAVMTSHLIAHVSRVCKGTTTMPPWFPLAQLLLLLLNIVKRLRHYRSLLCVDLQPRVHPAVVPEIGDATGSANPGPGHHHHPLVLFVSDVSGDVFQSVLLCRRTTTREKSPGPIGAETMGLSRKKQRRLNNFIPSA